MWTRAELKEKAKAHIKANYWPTVVVTFVLVTFVLATATNATNGQDYSTIGKGEFQLETGALTLAAIISFALTFFVIGPLAVGCRKFYLENAKGNQAKAGLMISMFKDPAYFNVCGTIFMKDLFIALWGLLFIIPGIIKSFEYSQVDYIVAENPSINYKDALAQSKRMMKGNKWKSFVLDLSFILWDLLEAIPFVAYFWTQPYKKQTEGELYLALKK